MDITLIREDVLWLLEMLEDLYEEFDMPNEYKRTNESILHIVKLLRECRTPVTKKSSWAYNLFYEDLAQIRAILLARLDYYCKQIVKDLIQQFQYERTIAGLKSAKSSVVVDKPKKKSSPKTAETNITEVRRLVAEKKG